MAGTTTKARIFTGVGTALITPMNEQGVDYENFGPLIDWQIEEGVDALIIAGTSGEGSTLSDQEHKDVVRYAVERVDGRVPVIAGTGSNDTAYGLQLTRACCDYGVDGVLGQDAAKIPAMFRPLFSGRDLSDIPAMLLLCALTIVVTAAVNIIGNYGARVMTTKGSEKFVMLLRNSLYDHIQHLPFSWFVKEAETADQYIEKTAAQIPENRRVTVASSDGIVQVIILGAGAVRMSATGLLARVQEENRRMRQEYTERNTPIRHTLFDGVPKELADRLERMRLGDSPEES